MFTEKSAIEDYLIKELQTQGWQFVPADELERQSLEEPLLLSLPRNLRKINQDLGIGEQEIRQVTNELKLKSTGIEAAKDIINYLKFGIPVKLEKERTVVRARLFDFEDTKNNEFIVSRQVYYKSADNTIRVDLILYINGIPLVVIECKNPVSLSVSWYDGYKDIKDYEKKIPELFKYIQIGAAVEKIAKYFPVVPWQDEAIEISEWRSEDKDSVDSLSEMLSPEVLLDIIKSFLFFKIKFGNATKILPRYMQYRATNKIVDRVLANLSGKEEKNKGLIWHWQGSGKTLTMIFAAYKLFLNKVLENPTIFFIVDRDELEEQLYQDFTSLNIPSPQKIQSVEDLKKTIMHDNLKGERGIFITLIHKFSPQEFNEFGKELLRISQERQTITSRKNVVCFIDEGHRTQYGILSSQMKTILKNAFFFSFTGTPISKEGRDTFTEFSYPPQENYLDKYFILDSLNDGFTLKIAYQPRLQEDVHLNKDLLDTFLKEKIDELPDEIRDEVEERVKEKLNTIKIFLENPQRIKEICQDIAGHFKENIEGKFKAMIVAGSRKACVIYKRFLDELLPKEYSEIVITYTQKERTPEISDYHKELSDRFTGLDDEEIKKAIVDRFKEETHPKILIVTEMLLTGFDAPVLQVMYLDKLLKEHRLLQAIARTNRPFKNLKDCGLIIDYVGILKEFEWAFKVYSKEDLNGALIDFDKLREEYAELIKKSLTFFKDISKKDYSREALIKAFETITTDEEITKEFIYNVKLLRKKFELLGPDVIKTHLFEDYKWLMVIYNYYQMLVSKTDEDVSRYIENYFNKTVKYVYQTAQIEDMQKDMPVIAFDVEYLNKLEEKIKSKEEKTANIVFTLNKMVLVDRYKNPVYETLADKVQRILEMWRNKAKDYEAIYREGVKVVEEINALSERQKKLGLSDLEYSVLLILERRFPKVNFTEDAKELVTILKDKIFPGWTLQKTVMKEVEREIRRFLRKYVPTYNIDLAEIDNLSSQIKDNFEEYGKS